MTEHFEFVVFFGMLVVFIVVLSLLAAYPGAFLNTPLGKWRGKNSTPKQLRIFSLLGLVVVLAFFFTAVVQLARGTFKLRGNPKTYSFSDFWR